MNKISVVIPTYNRASTIKKSISSVLNQTYQDIEIIVVDDCSVDNTKEVVDSINDDRIKYIKLPENHGAAYARNIGVENSAGKYIAFQDSDDIFVEDKLEKQLKNMTKNKSDMDFCKIQINNYRNSIIIPDNNTDNKLKKIKLLDRLCEGNLISTQAILAKKEIFKDIKFDDRLPRFQDYDLVLRIASKYKISYTKEVLVNLYRQKDSISSSNSKLRKACVLMLNKDYNLTEKQQDILNENLLSANNMDKIIELDAKNHKNKIEIINLKNKLKDAERHQKELDELVNSLNNTIIEKEQEINNMLNSKSWKITKPLRKLSNIKGKKQ